MHCLPSGQLPPESQLPKPPLETQLPAKQVSLLELQAGLQSSSKSSGTQILEFVFPGIISLHSSLSSQTTPVLPQVLLPPPPQPSITMVATPATASTTICIILNNPNF